ncbi:MAG: cell division protein FtsK, partial [Candidatus Komeilibacteria bacterium CG_4_9_14_3_um_filter_37_5]
MEVPNQKVAIVKLREILESPSFRNSSSHLAVALGKDVSGTCQSLDIAKMPHCLIAGATGSGKSVCINNFILSLLYRNNPNELKMIMIDPKRVEMTPYNNIPHLLTPIITETGKAINALRWAVGEMENRLTIFNAAGKKDIESYNKSVLVNQLPYIVVVIDELAELMMV